MAARRRGADALVQSLAAAGVRRVFALSGNHVMPVFDATLDSAIALIHTRHEAAAVHMADAWSRLTGEVGVALVTGGPGHANAVSALYTAQMAEAPIVLLSGHAPNAQRGMGAFQEMAQADMAAPVTKASWTCDGPEAIANDVAKAFRIARSGRPGPVHLSLPSDALEGAAPLLPALPPAAFAADPLALAPSAGERVLDRLGAAKRPLILVGPSSLTRAGRARVLALEAATGIPVVGMESPRGIADPSLGAFAEVLAQADCVLLLGKRLDFTLKFGAPPTLDATCAVMQIDADEAELARSRRALNERLVVALRADAHSALATLTRRGRAHDAPPSHWREQVRAATAYRPAEWHRATSTEPGRLHPVEALRPLQSLLDSHPDAVFVSDGGEIGQWAQACLHAPHRVINGVAGAIGAALPFAVAARCALPDAPGDRRARRRHRRLSSGRDRHRGALSPAVRRRHRQRRALERRVPDPVREYGRDRLVGCELLPTRYDLVVAALGGHGEHVTEGAQVLPAARRAIASGVAACVDVAIEGLAAPRIKTGADAA